MFVFPFLSLSLSCAVSIGQSLRFFGVRAFRLVELRTDTTSTIVPLPLPLPRLSIQLLTLPPFFQATFCSCSKGWPFLHSRNIIHRDLKPSNILLNNRGIAKICDFGFVRQVRRHHESRYTPVVVTLWYRPPEILLGSQEHTFALDMWSAGCILFEMYTRTVLFHGKDDLTQLDQIYAMCGVPDEASCPGLSKWSVWQQVQPRNKYPRILRRKLTDVRLCHAAVDLIDRLLLYDISKRDTAVQAMHHPMFTTEPLPALPESLSGYNEHHKWCIKQRQKHGHAATSSSSILRDALPADVKRQRV
eukprot:NODE_1398_length_1552_cov_37.000000_g1259_i0.p1 GENE.NODE_1398_length_1552_cov_37.000000_g1259_i0~~NODE_1398_length_1552_cov_37.000000_g1259_i0.p1  ORF type:complete len:303 (-),score=40.96 NODE_1398_length_1552_cov_37.000000_g1259_i0:84-992(-)